MNAEHGARDIGQLLEDAATQPARPVDPVGLRRRARRRRQALHATTAGVAMLVLAGAGLVAGGAPQRVPMIDAPDDDRDAVADDETPPTATEADEHTPSRSEIEARDIPEGEIEAVAEHHGLSSEQAELRIRLEEAMRGLDDRLQARWPETYAGAVLPTGTLTVEVRFAGEVADPRRRRSEVGEEFAYPDRVEIRDGLEHTVGDARDVYAQIADDLERLHETGEHPLEVVREAGGHGIGVGLAGNEVTLTVTEAARQELAGPGDPQGTRRLRDAARDHYHFDNLTVDPVGDPRNDPGTAGTSNDPGS